MKMTIDTNKYKNLYWTEAIGPINLWEEKYNIKRLHATYVAELLSVSPDDIEYIEDDECSYYLKSLNKSHLKRSVFIIDLPETFDNIIQTEHCNQDVDIKNQFKEYCESLITGNFNYNINEEFFLISDMYSYIRDGRDYNDFINITSECYDLMKLLLNRCKYIIDNHSENISKDNLWSLNCEYKALKNILEKANILILHKFQ